MDHRLQLTIRALAFATALAAVSPTLPSEATAEPPCERLVVRVELSDPTRIGEISSWTEPWEVSRDGRSLVVGVDAAGLERLRADGFDFAVDFEATLEACAPHVRQPGQLTGIPGYPCYRTVEETYADAAQLAADYPTLASWIDVGDSWEKTTPGGASGYDLQVLRLTNSEVVGTPVGGGDQEGKPRLFVTASIHAREYTPAELATRFAELLLSQHGIDPDITWLLDEHEIHLLLHANPDGRKHAETGDYWRKNTDEAYCPTNPSSRGADLNRNFPFQWGCCNGSSTNGCDETYRGPSPGSEPEVQAISGYGAAIFPDQRGTALDDPAPLDATGVYIDVHSSGELVLWSWGFTPSAAPNVAGLQALGRRFAWYNGHHPEQSIGLYPTDGTTDDHFYGELGVAAYTFELGTSFFQSCDFFENEILPGNIAALLYAAKVARTPYQTAHGPSVLELEATSGAFVAPGDPLTIAALADDTVFSTANGVEPTQAITEAEATLDAPPWTDPAPTPIALTAQDGLFDTPTEAIEGLVDTTGLADGRHMLYIRARDASGAWGPVTALFFWTLDPATAGRIEGAVLETGSGAPLAATVDVGLTSTATDPGDGSYGLLLPPDSYDVSAFAPGYETASEAGVTAPSGGTAVVDFALPRLPAETACDAESGSAGWVADPPWAITTESAHGGTHAWSDSPGGDYGNNVDASLTSPRLNLSAVHGVQLTFWHRYDFEAGWDYGRVEVSTDGGASWQQVAQYDGNHLGSWEEVVLALPQLDGALEARVRFRSDTDVSLTRDGWYLDDLAFGGVPGESPLFADGFESGTTDAWGSVSP